MKAKDNVPLLYLEYKGAFLPNLLLLSGQKWSILKKSNYRFLFSRIYTYQNEPSRISY